MIVDITPCFILNAPGQAYIIGGLFIYNLLLSQSKRRLDLNFDVTYTRYCKQFYKRGDLISYIK